MSDQEQNTAGYSERSTGRVRLLYRSGRVSPERVDELLARASRVAAYVDACLKPLNRTAPAESRGPVTLYLDTEPSRRAEPGSPDGAADLFERTDHVPVTPESPGRDLEERLALLMVRQRFGGPEFWSASGGPPSDEADAEGAVNALRFLALGLSRHLASQAAAAGSGGLFATAGGTAPRQSADEVCRRAAADREGKVPIYECLLRGPALASSPPEYAALAESFCGYLFERQGAKSYRRFARDCRDNPNAAADLVYAKTLEELQREWLNAILSGDRRRLVTLGGFARRIGPYLRPYAWMVVLILVLTFFSTGVAQIIPFALRDILDIAVKAAGKGNFPEFVADLGDWLFGETDLEGFKAKQAVVLDALSGMYAKIVIMGLTIFVTSAGTIWLVYVNEVVGQNILRDLRLRLTERLHHLNAGFYARQRMGDMIVRFTADIPRMAEPLIDVATYTVYYSVFLIFTVVAMWVMSPQLSGLLFLIVPIYIVASRKLGPAIQVAIRGRQERLSQLNANFEEMLFGHSLVKAYGLSSHLMRRFRPKIAEYRKVAIWADFIRLLYLEMITVVDNVQGKLVWALGGTLIVFGQMTVGTVAAFNGQMSLFVRRLHGLASQYRSVAAAAASLRRIEEVLREPMEFMDTPPGGAYAPEAVRDAITFEHVSFSYTGVEPTLIDINVRLPAGSHVAFVGPTGAGKSTLVNLLPRFYDADQGAVKIDGRDVRSFSLGGLRQAISIVSQDTFLFNSTIMENIRLGRMDASDEDVIEAAKGARLHDFITSHPAGYDLLVGERGWRLSGGQRQRVAIARALLRGSPILILDEATSSLDAETESEILSELDEVTRGKTVISITHRLGLAIKSDTIFVLQAGRIVEQGSHEELIGNPGLYRKLFEDQNRELIERGAIDPHEAALGKAGSMPIFSVVSAEELAGMADLSTTRRYTAGDVFCEPDGADGRLYLLRSGQVELTMRDEQGDERRLQIGAPLDGSSAQPSAASMTLLINLPRSVSAKALTEIEVQLLQDGDLPKLYAVRGDGKGSYTVGSTEKAQADDPAESK